MRRILALLGLTALAFGGLSVVLTPPASAGPRHGMNRWALIIGIDQHYGKTRTNVGSVGDAEDLRRALIEKHQWPADHIRLLTNKQATQAAIRGGIRWLIDNSNEDSFSLFHYSGHTKQVTDKKNRDGDGEATDEFLWPADNKFISDNELSAHMQALRGLAWVDIAACEAAGFNDRIHSERRLFTASSQENEKSYENKDWRNSVFTGLMVDYGMLRNSADANSNGVVSIHEGFNFAAQHAPEYTKKQKNGRQRPYLAGGDGSEWLLDPPPPPPSPPTPPPKACLVDPIVCL